MIKKFQDEKGVLHQVDYIEGIANKPTKLSEFENDMNYVSNNVDNLVNYYVKS